MEIKTEIKAEIEVEIKQAKIEPAAAVAILDRLVQLARARGVMVRDSGYVSQPAPLPLGSQRHLTALERMLGRIHACDALSARRCKSSVCACIYTDVFVVGNTLEQKNTGLQQPLPARKSSIIKP